MRSRLVEDGEADFQTILLIEFLSVTVVYHLLDLGDQVDAAHIVKDHFQDQFASVTRVLRQV